jgi:hypothetical protein
MSATAATTIGRKVWIGVRFILFGLVGFWVMLFAFGSFTVAVLEHHQEFLSPFLSLPLTVVGAVMILYGGGEWGRWAYLWVFLSIPVSLFLLVLTGCDEGLPVVAAVAAFGSYAIVRAYYTARVRDMQIRAKDSHVHGFLSE